MDSAEEICLPPSPQKQKLKKQTSQIDDFDLYYVFLMLRLVLDSQFSDFECWFEGLNQAGIPSTEYRISLSFY